MLWRLEQSGQSDSNDYRKWFPEWLKLLWEYEDSGDNEFRPTQAALLV